MKPPSELNAEYFNCEIYSVLVCNQGMRTSLLLFPNYAEFVVRIIVATRTEDGCSASKAVLLVMLICECIVFLRSLVSILISLWLAKLLKKFANQINDTATWTIVVRQSLVKPQISLTFVKAYSKQLVVEFIWIANACFWMHKCACD